MTRVLNFCCIVITALACLALNHVSDQTRVADAQLQRTDVEISAANDSLKLLQADWERVSDPSRIQTLAATRLGLEDTATVQVASLELLPRRGDETGTAGVTTASTTTGADAHIHLAAVHSGD